MFEFEVGDYVEVGIGENPQDKEGYSFFFRVDKEGYTEDDIMDIFSDRGNVLYAQEVSDKSAIEFAGNSKLSDFLGEESSEKYVKIELDVKLPNDYDESEVDEAIVDAIRSIGGEVLNSKEYQELKECIRIELETILPSDYNESRVDMAIADAIYDLDGEVIDSKEYKEIVPTNI